MSNKVEEIITEKFIEALENGVCPWRKPWNGSATPQNFITKKPYNGINFFLLSLMPYSSPYWMTYKQASAKGGKVKKGEKATLVTFWKLFKTTDKKTGEAKQIPLLRYYNVFNLEQCEGIEAPASEEKPLDFCPIEEAEKFASDYCEKEDLEVTFKENQAYYSPATDYVNMPRKESFKGEQGYYSTLFHELAHSTGHAKRLNRLEKCGFGSESYAKEELVAELSAAFACAELGLDNTFGNSAAYLQGWIKKLKGDSKLLISASSYAKKAFTRLKCEEAEVYA